RVVRISRTIYWIGQELSCKHKHHQRKRGHLWPRFALDKMFPPSSAREGEPLVFGARSAEVHAGAVGEDDLLRVRARRTVLRLEAADHDLRARRQRVLRPAAAQQRARSAALDLPALDRAVFLLDVDVEPRMRIDPLEHHDFTLERDRLV